MAGCGMVEGDRMRPSRKCRVRVSQTDPSILGMSAWTVQLLQFGNSCAGKQRECRGAACAGGFFVVANTSVLLLGSGGTREGVVFLLEG